MKVARFYAPGDVRLEDMDEPTPGPDEVKIRVRNCSTCGTDVKIFNNGHPNMTPPQVMGHEIAGEVVEVGADVSGWSRGRRRAGDRRDPGRHVRGVPPGPDDGLHEPDVDGLPVPGRLRRVHDRARAPCWPSTGSTGSRTGSASPRRRWPSRSPACSTARSWPGSATATTSWSSVRARSAVCTSGWPGRAARSGCSSSTSTAGGWTCPRPRSTRRSDLRRRGRHDRRGQQADRRPRGGCRDHRGGRREGAGGRPADAGPRRPAERLRRSAEGQAEHHRRRQPGALPGADDRRGERLEPGRTTSGRSR